MNSNTTKQPSKFRRFLRNNAALLLLIFCVLAIAAVVLAVTLTRDNNSVIPDNPVTGNPDDNKPNVKPDDDKPSTPTTEKIDIHFASPLDYTKVGLDFTFGPDHLFVYKQTLNEYSSHKAVDLHAAEGTEVKSMYDGTVIESKLSYLDGYYVVIDHGDNVIATYASLSDVQVNVGDTVKQGDVLGYVSTTARCEFKEGPHLHLEVTADGKKVDPMPYVNGEVYRTVEVEVKK